MITCGLEQLQKQKEDELRLWLSQGYLSTLQRVVKAKAQKHICEALKDAIGASGEGWTMDVANASLKKAKRYADFLAVLQEIIEQKEPYETAKLS